MKSGRIRAFEDCRLSPGGGLKIRGNVLDAGCRDGGKFRLLKELGAETIFAVEPDKEALGRAMKLGIVPPERCFACGVEGLPGSFGGFFDAAVLFTPSADMPALAAELGEIRRVLKPAGGILVYATGDGPSRAPYHPIALVKAGFRIEAFTRLGMLCSGGDAFFPGRGGMLDSYFDKKICVASV